MELIAQDMSMMTHDAGWEEWMDRDIMGSAKSSVDAGVAINERAEESGWLE